ncbi:hypothetical protein [Lysinibacillus fusiformis]|uniref:hypothetical protein n=1 Tax=Lysinibacillus fusiformis TaxID=28031 RepID=UPI003811831B
MWTKIVTSLGLVSIGIAIGMLTNLVAFNGDLGDNESNMYQDYNSYLDERNPAQGDWESPNPRGELTPEQWEEFTSKSGGQMPEQWDPSTPHSEESIHGSTSPY